MTTAYITTRLSPLAFAAVMDTAKTQALVLRREAINNFWQGVGAALSGTLGSAWTRRPHRLMHKHLEG